MDGILIINKPKTYTSHDIVNIARRVLQTKRIGHIGTLDPNATGVLVLCVDRATKLVKYFENHSKTYIATIRLGLQTNTDDITGKVIYEAEEVNISEEAVKAELDKMVGKQKQIPPKFSAIKVNGKKLYELARRDLSIPHLEPRDIEIFSIEDFQTIQSSPYFDFRITVKVSKGTYIRSIARDLGEALDVFGTLLELERIEIDRFKIEDAIDLERFEAGEYELKNPFDYLNIPKFVLDHQLEHLVRHGRFLNPEVVPYRSEVVFYSDADEPLAIYYYDEQKNQMRMSVKWC